MKNKIKNTDFLLEKGWKVFFLSSKAESFVLFDRKNSWLAVSNRDPFQKLGDVQTLKNKISFKEIVID